MHYQIRQSSKLLCWFIAIGVLTVIQTGITEAQDAFTKKVMRQVNRFQLYNTCRPMILMVGSLSDTATTIGLTEDRLRVAAESRLRAARLYADVSSVDKANGSILTVRASVVGAAFHSLVEYNKILFDPASGENNSATTWSSSVTGTHGRDPGYIIQSISEKLDKFLVEYLRVNEEACHKR